MLVSTRPNLRGGRHSMMSHVGLGALETMFDKCEVDESVTSLNLFYPERWTNILEQRAIPLKMLACFPNLTKVDIETHSVYIIQSVHSEHIGITDMDLQETYTETSKIEVETRYCESDKGGNNGLMVFGGSIRGK